MIEQKENLIGSRPVPNAPKRQHPSRNINKQSDQVLSVSAEAEGSKNNKNNGNNSKTVKKEI